MFSYKVLAPKMQGPDGPLRVGDVITMDQPAKQYLIEDRYLLPVEDSASIGKGKSGGVDEQSSPQSPKRRGRPRKDSE